MYLVFSFHSERPGNTIEINTLLHNLPDNTEFDRQAILMSKELDHSQQKQELTLTFAVTQLQIFGTPSTKSNTTLFVLL